MGSHLQLHQPLQERTELKPLARIADDVQRGSAGQRGTTSPGRPIGIGKDLVSYSPLTARYCS